MPGSAIAFGPKTGADDPIVAPALEIDPSVEAFAAGEIALVLKCDGSAAHIRGRAAAALIGALDRQGDMPWQDHIAEPILRALAPRLAALGFLHRSAGGEPAIDMLSARLALRGAETLHLVETHSFFRPGLAPIMQRADRRARIAVRVGAARTWLSPVFGQRGGLCWMCFVRRLAAQDELWALDRRGVLRPLPRLGGQALIGAPIADRIAEALSSRRSDDELIIVDHDTARCRRHGVRPLPDCRCASHRPGARAEPQRSADLLDRVRAAAGGMIDAVTGAITDARSIEGQAGDPIHVAVAGFADPSGRLGGWLADAAGLRISGRPTRSAFGAAPTARDAAAKAMLEAIERDCAIARGDEPIRYASAAALGELAVDIRRGISGAERSAMRAWLPARRLSGDTRYVPASTVLAGWRGAGDEPRYSSNGTAIAFDRDDAIVRGFLELVERDATTIWWYNRVACPAIDLASFGDAFVDDFAAHLASLGRSITVFDLTGDLGVPVLAAMVTDPGWTAPIFGFAARFDIRDAMMGALCELGQALRFAEQEQAKWRGFDWGSQPHLAPGYDVRRSSDYPPAASAGIATCAAIARRMQFDLLVCDLDRADIGLPVCKVIVPQLLPPGRPALDARLLETPVRLGWRQRPCTPEELNPQILPM